MIREVHLPTNANARIDSRTCRGFPLNRDEILKLLGITEETPFMLALVKILNYLDVENSLRYKREGKTTWCNIYAYDFLYLLGFYLAHIFWNADSIKKIESGKSPAVIYGKTVYELTANDVFNWLIQYGGLFGWKEAVDDADFHTSLADFQSIGIIAAKGKIGHLSVSFFTPYRMDEDTVSFRSQMSQAGWENKKLFSDDEWYKGMEHKFWVNRKKAA